MGSTSSALLIALSKLGARLVTDLRGPQADEERTRQLKGISAFSSSFYVLPLFLTFSLADHFFYSSHFFEFLAYRVSTVVIIVVLNALIQRQTTLLRVQVLCTLFILDCAAPLHLMLYRIGDSSSPYYAGLTLVAIGMAMGFRFTRGFYVLNLSLVITPFMGLILYFGDSLLPSGLSLLFLASVGLIGTVSRVFQDDLHRREFESRQALEGELVARNRIIKEKTEEAVAMTHMAKQFSPQVVNAVKNGTLNLGRPVHRAEICVIFIDIVGSTDRFIRLDREDLHRVLTMYMEDTMDSLLKFDITIDKFLGDGVIGFSNDPIAHPEFIERVIEAAVLINTRITNRKRQYEELWLAPFEIGIGISTGYASVGFYGSDKHLKSYTAIGRVVNLAARLGSAAAGGQILLSNESVARLEKQASPLLEKVGFREIGSSKLKGFENDVIRIYEVQERALNATAAGKPTSPICPFGHGELLLDVNDRGIFQYRCAQCSFAMKDIEQFRGKLPNAA
jgi:adenylate cyclase